MNRTQPADRLPSTRRELPDSRLSAEADGRRSRWVEHRTQRRAAFVAAGVEAIDTFGPGASAEQIAEAAGVSRTVLYRYFRDRDDLLLAIADHVAHAVLDSVLPQLRVGRQRTLHETITLAITSIVGWLDEHPNLYRFMRSRRDGAMDSVETTLADSVAGLLKTVMVLAGIDGHSAEPAAYGIVGYVESTGVWWLEHRSTMSAEQLTDVVSTGVWHLLDGIAHERGISLSHDEVLPLAALSRDIA